MIGLNGGGTFGKNHQCLILLSHKEVIQNFYQVRVIYLKRGTLYLNIGPKSVDMKFTDTTGSNPGHNIHVLLGSINYATIRQKYDVTLSLFTSLKNQCPFFKYASVHERTP